MHEKKEVVIGISVSLLLMAVAALFIGVVVSAVNLESVIPEPIVGAIFIIITLGVGAISLVLFEKEKLSSLFLGDSRNRILLWGLLGGVLITIFNNPSLISKFSDSGGHIVVNNRSAAMIFSDFLFLGILCPFFEEVYFRGCLFRMIRDTFNIYWAFIVSTGLFLIGHSYSSVDNQTQMLIVSSILTLIYHGTNSVLSSGVAHSINSMVFVLWAPESFF